LARLAGKVPIYKIWKRDKEKIKKSSSNYEAEFKER